MKTLVLTLTHAQVAMLGNAVTNAMERCQFLQMEADDDWVEEGYAFRAAEYSTIRNLIEEAVTGVPIGDQ